MRALMAGGAHLQLALRVARQNTALEIKTTGGFLKARSGTHALAYRQRIGTVARKLRQQRDHQLVEGQGGRDRVTRQAAEPAVLKLAKSERFARLDGQLPEGDFTQLFGMVLV